MPTVAEQSKVFLQGLQSRKREKTKPATLRIYDSYLRNWIIPELGQLDLSQVKNNALKALIAKMSEEGLAPATISGITNCTKALLKSAVDDDGNFLYPVRWNSDFLDLPVVKAREQESPIITSEGIFKAISEAPAGIAPLLVMLASTGARISEILAVRRGPVEESSYWDSDDANVVIETQIYQGYEIAPKTSSGYREIDLAPIGNQYLIDSLKNRPEGEYLFVDKDGDPWTLSKLYKALKNTGIPGFHSFRRFRTTHLRSCRIPEDIIQFWIGHSGKTITDRYSKMAEDVEARKKYAAEAGLGFELPIR